MITLNKEISSTNTKAIQCEILAQNPVSDYSLKFIDPSCLQKVVEKAKCDFHYMLIQSLRKNSASKKFTHPIKKKVKDSIPILNSTSSETDYAPQTNYATRRQDQIHSSKEIPFPRKSRSIKLKENIPQKSNLIAENFSLNRNEDRVQESSHLSEEDLKWLGKNYCANHSGSAIFKNIDSKLHCETKFKKGTPHLKKSEENQSNIHKSATNLISRLLVREQQLWGRLAELSLTSVSSPSSEAGTYSSLENYQTTLINLSAEKIPLEKNSDIYNCNDILPFTSSNHRNITIPISTTDIVSLLGEEWLINLLRDELGILLNDGSFNNNLITSYEYWGMCVQCSKPFV